MIQMPQITVMSIKVVKKDLSRLNLEPKARTKDLFSPQQLLLLQQTPILIKERVSKINKEKAPLMSLWYIQILQVIKDLNQ
jgi:hypothetical protein